MRVSFARLAVAAALAFPALSAASSAHAESVMSACAAQWKNAQAAGTTGGATWPQFLKQCKEQVSPVATAPAPAPAPAPTQSGSLFPWMNPAPVQTKAAPAPGQSVMAACGEQWRQAKAAGTTGGATWPQYLKQCRAQMSGASTAAATPAPAAPAPAAPAPAPAAPSQSGSLFPWLHPSQTAPAPTGAGQFTTEAEARYRCPTDKVVWVNTASHIYHYQGSHNYGHTKQGAYMCEADAKAGGSRASRSHLFHRDQS